MLSFRASPTAARPIGEIRHLNWTAHACARQAGSLGMVTRSLSSRSFAVAVRPHTWLAAHGRKYQDALSVAMNSTHTDEVGFSPVGVLDGVVDLGCIFPNIRVKTPDALRGLAHGCRARSQSRATFLEINLEICNAEVVMRSQTVAWSSMCSDQHRNKPSFDRSSSVNTSDSFSSANPAKSLRNG